MSEYGGDTFGGVTFGGHTGAESGLQQSVLDEILSNPNYDREFRLIARPVDPKASLGTYLRFHNRDYVNYGDVLDVGSSDSFAISLRFRKYPGTEAMTDRMSQKLSAGGVGFLLTWETSDKILFRVNDGSTTVDCRTSEVVRSYIDGKWHRLVAIYNSPTSPLPVMNLWIDGIQVSSNFFNNTIGSLAGTGSLLVGSNSGNGFHGDIDDVRVYFQNSPYSTHEEMANAYMHEELPDPTNELGLYIYSKFNEGSGNFAYDSSGNSRHGLITGAIYAGSLDGTETVERYSSTHGSKREALNPFGRYLSWDGVGADNVSYGDVQDVGAADDFSVQIRFRSSDKGISKGIASKMSALTGVPGWRINFNNSDNLVFRVDDGIDSEIITQDGSAYLDGEWHSLCAVFDRTADNLKLYVDGELFATSGSISDIGDMSNAENLVVGLYTSSAGPWIGDLDDFRFWSKALTEDENKATIHDELRIPSLNASREEVPEIYSRFSKGRGSTVSDFSGNGRLGTITGLTWGGTERVGPQSFPRTLVKPYNARFSLGGAAELFTGASDPSVSDIEIARGDGRHADWPLLDWAKREADLYIGRPGATWDRFQLVARLLTDDLDGDEDRLRLAVRDYKAKFDRNIQERTYWGTGPCLRFDGVGDWVDFGDIHDQGATDSFTVEALFRGSFTGENRSLANKQGGVTSAGWRFVVSTGDQLVLFLHDGTTGFGQGADVSAYLDNNWHMASAVVDRVEQVFRIYVDGDLIRTSSSISFVGSLSNAQPLQLGTGLTDAFPWKGDLDEFRFWTYARKQVEIQSDMHRELTEAEVRTYTLASKLAGYWKLNDDSGSTAADSTTAGNDGTITGAVWIGSGEGESDLYGKTRLGKWGLVKQGRCVLVDKNLLVYEANFGPVEGIGEGIGPNYGVFDGGSKLNFDFDSDVVDIWDAVLSFPPAAGDYITCKASGHIALGAKPTSELTADVWGINDGPLGFVVKAADIVRDIATRRAGLVDPDDLYVSKFDTLNIKNDSPVSFETGLSPVKIDDAFTRILSYVGAHWGSDRLGRLSVGRVEDPSLVTAKYKIIRDDIRPSEFGGEFSFRSSWRPVDFVDLGYRRYEVTLKQGDIYSAAEADERQDLSEEYRRVSAGDPSSAEFISWDTSIVEKEDAQEEAGRILSLLGARRSSYTISPKTHRSLNGSQTSAAKSVIFTFELGDVVLVDTPDGELEGGKNLVVVSFVEDVGDYGREDSVILELWG